MKKMKKINISLYLLTILSFNVFGETSKTMCENFLSHDYRNANSFTLLPVLHNGILTCKTVFVNSSDPNAHKGYYVTFNLDTLNTEYHEKNTNVFIEMAGYSSLREKESLNKIRYFEKNLIEYTSKYNETNPLKTISELNLMHRIIDGRPFASSISGCYY